MLHKDTMHNLKNKDIETIQTKTNKKKTQTHTPNEHKF